MVGEFPAFVARRVRLPIVASGVRELRMKLLVAAHVPDVWDALVIDAARLDVGKRTPMVGTPFLNRDERFVHHTGRGGLRLYGGRHV